MQIEEYSPLAMRTEAPHPEMTEKKIRLIHAALGLTSEVVELSEALRVLYAANSASERKAIQLNVAEELSDLCWFHNLACKALSHLPPFEAAFQVGEGNPMEFLTLKAGEFADLVKAHTFYSKPNEFEMQRVLCRIEDALIWMAGHLQFDGFGVGTIPELRAKNIAKLKARYPDKFSEQAALNRDKVAEYEAIDKA